MFATACRTTTPPLPFIGSVGTFCLLDIQFLPDTAARYSYSDTAHVPCRRRLPRTFLTVLDLLPRCYVRRLIFSTPAMPLPHRPFTRCLLHPANLCAIPSFTRVRNRTLGSGSRFYRYRCLPLTFPAGDMTLVRFVRVVYRDIPL